MTANAAIDRSIRRIVVVTMIMLLASLAALTRFAGTLKARAGMAQAQSPRR